MLAWQNTVCSGAPDLLLLHGILGASDDWLPLMQSLASTHACAVPDLPGHGRTGVLDPSEYAMPRLAQTLLAQTSGQVHVVGYSMGARLALYLALFHPERVASAVVISGSPGLENEEEQGARKLADARLARRLRSEPFADWLLHWYDQPLFATLKSRPDFQALWARRLNNNPEGIARSLEGMGLGEQPSLWRALEGCQVPILFVCGAQDKKFLDLSVRMSEICPGSSLSVIENCGHNVLQEAPEALTKLIGRWIPKGA